MNIDKHLEVKENQEELLIRSKGEISMSNGSELEIYLKNISTKKYKKIILDLSEINEYDSFLVVFINGLKSISELEIKGSNDDVKSFIKRFSFEKLPGEVKGKGNLTFFENTGNTAISIYNDIIDFVEFFGNLLINIASLIFRPGKIRWDDFPYQFLRAGVNAIPIVLLILFLIGLITGYQGAIQLEKYGADIYIADLVGVSITRELSPLMVAIIVAGRSGSAFAAEIGTMKVSEEIDALKSMGFDVFAFLIMPRLLAVAIAMPFLTMLADLTGIIGGMVSGLAELNITMTGYFNELNLVLWYSDILTGLLKSIVFGVIIAAVGCYRGLQVSGGAESVGQYTTASVVTSIFLIIVTNAIFTIFFQSIGI